MKLYIDRNKVASRIFHIVCSKGGTIPGVPIPTPPIVEGLKFSQMSVATNDPDVVKVYALKKTPEGATEPVIDIGPNPALSGVLAIINSSPAGGGMAGRFLMVFGGGDGTAIVWVAVRHRSATADGKAGPFTGRIDKEMIEVVVYNSAQQPAGSAEVLDFAIVEGDPN